MSAPGAAAAVGGAGLPLIERHVDTLGCGQRQL
jgi:hypothetical protein